MRERVVVEAHQALDRVVHARARPTPASSWRLRRRPRPADRRRLPCRAARCAPPRTSLADGEPQRHRHAIAAVRDQLLHAAVAHARHLAVQRERDGVEQRALAGAGRSGNREQRQRREIQRRLRVAKAREALDVERERPHALGLRGERLLVQRVEGRQQGVGADAALLLQVAAVQLARRKRAGAIGGATGSSTPSAESGPR